MIKMKRLYTNSLFFYLYYSCIKKLNIDNNKLYFLNNKDYGNENDNSSVIYTEQIIINFFLWEMQE